MPGEQGSSASDDGYGRAQEVYMRKGILLAGLLAGVASFAASTAQAVEIEYWQYV